MSHRTKCIIHLLMKQSTRCMYNVQRQEMERSICQTSADFEIKQEIRLQMFFILFCSKLPEHCIRDVLSHIAFY